MPWNIKASPLPPASLQLLVPPVRLMSAFMWKVVQQDNVKQYDKLLDFISLTTEIVPELLCPSQKAQLILGLRAKLVLELCRGDGVANLKIIQGHLDKIHTCCVELSNSHQLGSADILKTSYSNFANLVQNIINIPLEKELFFKQFFPENYGSTYNQRIQQLLSVFLSRLEELLPVPDLQQTTVWLTETSASEEFGHHLTEQLALKTLLVHHRTLGTLSSACSSNEEDIILSTLALSNQPEQFIEDDDDDDDKSDGDEGTLELNDLDDDTDDSEDWVPKNKSGSLSRLCSKCPNKQQIQGTVQEHVQCEHHKTAPSQEEKSVKKGRRKTVQKGQDSKAKNKKRNVNVKNKRRGKPKDSPEIKTQHEQKEENSKKSRQRPKEPTGEDKRFLSTRSVNKNYPEGEIKCPTCQKVFEHPNQLKTHIKLHNFRLSCIQCEKGFTSKTGYYHHQKLHKKGRVFVCEQCNKGFLCNNSLKQHERLHNGPTNFCKICDKNFSRNGFVRHMQMHRGEKNYLCTTCGKAFLSSGELLLHNRTHTGELPYTCVHCGKGFSCKGHLTVHTRSHTGERPYLCTVCPKRFITLHCLKRHMLSHSVEKPFQCSMCKKEFTQQGNLKRHMVVHKADT